MVGCFWSHPLPQQKKYASCYGNERKSDERRSRAEGSDSWTGLSV